MLETHYERFLVINNREIDHSGYFLAEEFFRMLNTALKERGYHQREKKSDETVTEEGITSFVELRPYKEKSHYVTFMVKFKISFNNFVNEAREIEGYKKMFQKGDVKVIIDAWYMTEFESRWGQKPIVFFLKGIINKLVYTFPTEAKFRSEIVEDVAYFTAKIKRLLRSYRHPESALPAEGEVMRSVEEEVQREKDIMEKETAENAREKQPRRSPQDSSFSGTSGRLDGSSP